MSDNHSEEQEKAKILIVDDRPANLFALEKILEPLDIEIFEASSGLEAISLVVRHDFSLILMDVQMPEMDGFETASMIRKNKASREIPIIFVTAIRTESGNIYTGYDSGAVDYLFKPIDPNILLGKVRVFLTLFEQKQELKRKNQELKNVKQYLSDVIDSMPSTMIGLDQQKQIVHWNVEAEKILGASRSFACGKSIFKVVPQLEFCDSLIEDAQQSGKAQKAEKIKIKFLEKHYYVDIMIYPLVKANIKGVIIRLDDVTQRVAYDEVVIRTEKMISLGGLANGVAHEINNPLCIILQSAQNTLRRLNTHSPRNLEEAKNCNVNLENMQKYLKNRRIIDFLHNIESATERAAKIVSCMFRFSNISKSKFRKEDVNKLMERALMMVPTDLKLIQPMTQFHKIRIIKEFEHSPCEIYCAPNELEQVFMHLIKNAIEAIIESSPIEPTLIIRTKKIGDELLIEVEDNGAGMDEEVRKRVFEPFFTTKEVGSGLGLGLAISYFIITMDHRGSFNLDSSRGKGSRFTIKLPNRDFMF